MTATQLRVYPLAKQFCWHDPNCPFTTRKTFIGNSVRKRCSGKSPNRSFAVRG